MKGSDQDVGRGVGGVAKAVYRLKELVRGGFEARCVGVKRKKKNTDEAKGGGVGVQQSYRWRWGDGKV